MELSRLGIKLFAADSQRIPREGLRTDLPFVDSEAVRREHQLIDVHDYSHIHHGPGILLVAHEGNFSTDMAEGKRASRTFASNRLAAPPKRRYVQA